MRVGRLISTALLILAAGCTDPGLDYHVYVYLESGASVPTTFRAGDTVRFLATITHKDRFDFEGPEQVRSRSDERPDLFTWSVADTAIAEIIEPGVAVMHAAGHTTLSVFTASATGVVELNVVWPDPATQRAGGGRRCFVACS